MTAVTERTPRGTNGPSGARVRSPVRKAGSPVVDNALETCAKRARRLISLGVGQDHPCVGLKVRSLFMGNRVALIQPSEMVETRLELCQLPC